MASPSVHRITLYITISMLLGGVVGWVLGPKVAPLGVIGSIYIQLIKTIAVPLVFVSILEAIIATSLSWKTARTWASVVTINAVCALGMGLTISNLIRPGQGFVFNAQSATSQSAPMAKEFSLRVFTNELVPSSIIAPFLENNVLGVIILALLLGGAVRAYYRNSEVAVPIRTVTQVIQFAGGVTSQLLLWLVQLVPLAVFCVTARTVGESGLASLKGLALYVLCAALGFVLQIVLVYPLWIRGVGGIGIKRFFRHALKPLAYALGTNSSLATVPLSLEALDSLGVSKSASRLATCIGTNCNNDGILLYEAMAVLFVAQACGVELSLGEQVVAAVVSLLAAIGVAGVPEAGVVSLALVISAVGLPTEILPVLLTVDWIVARMRSVVNVMSDLTVSVAVSGLEQRDTRNAADGAGSHP